MFGDGNDFVLFCGTGSAVIRVLLNDRSAVLNEGHICVQTSETSCVFIDKNVLCNVIEDKPHASQHYYGDMVRSSKCKPKIRE